MQPYFDPYGKDYILKGTKLQAIIWVRDHLQVSAHVARHLVDTTHKVFGEKPKQLIMIPVKFK